MPFEIRRKRAPTVPWLKVRGNQIVYLKTLREQENCVHRSAGFGPTARNTAHDRDKKRERHEITGDRPLVEGCPVSIRSVFPWKPFIA